MTVLVVDDDPVQVELLTGFLKKQGVKVFSAPNGDEGLKIFLREPVRVVLLDQRMPGPSGDKVLKAMKEANPMARIIMVTAYADVHTAVGAMKDGADEFLEKPLDLKLLLEKINALDSDMGVDEDLLVVEDELERRPLPLKVIARSPAMQKVLSAVRRVSDTDWPVLIEGETGTGKEVMARLIHHLSSRRDHPFVDLNCAAIPENLFESELFGHEKGSFTGAVSDRKGRFELADGGSLFLDEIGEMPLLLQPKLLRVIQEGKISRVGSEKSLPVNVRLISATNKDLKQSADEGRFRQDLFYRVKVLEIKTPSLRERKEDIPDLVAFFVEKYGKGPVRMTPEAMDMLVKYPFPGNVRELEHVIQRTVTMVRSSLIRPSDLPEEIRHHSLTTQGSLTERLENLEKALIRASLTESNWVQTRAAERLGISERVLRYKMQKHNLSKEVS
ncbi:MAG: two-component system response regulator [Deltaproteobacteria bacterium CG_4_8_14_3_um_filter_51_11]|nr:sigma-54-dependent Fis family transcriptional regulator [bacterium]OIP39890.1 MAG: two-component system response regulator [Desulfobacteraceae bacterium CG2_30_51_40]PIP47148.1 MAG: two-component system response regulator [Deltaproteobacteria bacterium CG23_combo_of_CG06-09_8_20_14_all_51_20]PIW01662.1 MAG: two-component system response regulator [Deltaproteobacteria bacterium CG17_big_fil_post_rev_8_21_14_2_50_51_6]PIX18867.1 MAG: two-component system response regulator [Deltaproteobacteria